MTPTKEKAQGTPTLSEKARVRSHTVIITRDGRIFEDDVEVVWVCGDCGHPCSDHNYPKAFPVNCRRCRDEGDPFRCKGYFDARDAAPARKTPEPEATT